MKVKIKKFFVTPCISGLCGFAMFFSILVLTKILSYYIGSMKYLEIDIVDVELAGIGFILTFLIRILQNFKESKF